MITKMNAFAMMHTMDKYKTACILTVVSEDAEFMKRVEKIYGKADVVKAGRPGSGVRPEYRYFIHKEKL